MSFYKQSVGIHNVGSYQVSGVPFVFNVGTNTNKTATLNYVTSEIQINTSGTGCKVHFGDTGTTEYDLPAGLSTFRVKCKVVKITTPAGQTASACISLTNIPARHLDQHTQSDWGTVP